MTAALSREQLARRLYAAWEDDPARPRRPWADRMARHQAPWLALADAMLPLLAERDERIALLRTRYDTVEGICATAWKQCDAQRGRADEAEAALADARRQAVEGSEPPGCPTPGACSCGPVTGRGEGRG